MCCFNCLKKLIYKIKNIDNKNKDLSNYNYYYEL